MTHLRGWRVGGRDVADDGGEVLCPEGALPLAVVPQRRRVLGAVDGEVVQDLPVLRHVPVHAQDVLRGRVSVKRMRLFIIQNSMWIYFIVIVLTHTMRSWRRRK